MFKMLSETKKAKMKRGESDWLVKETFLGDGITREFQIGQLKRPSIDSSDVLSEFDEDKSILKFFSEYGQIFLQLSGLGNGYMGFNISSIIDKNISKKPGDIDVAFVNENQNELHCFEVKRIKIGESINKLSGLKKAKKQIEGHLKYGFTTSSIVIICAIKEIGGRTGEFQKLVSNAISEHIGFDFLKVNGIGLIFIEHVQPDDFSINTKEMVRFTILFPPSNRSSDDQLVQRIMLDPKMERVVIPEKFNQMKLR